MICYTYVTAPNFKTAKMIAGKLIDERLAACANIFPKMTSIYRWKGAIQRETEVVLILKSNGKRLAALTRRVEQLHPYEVPCVVTFKSTKANRSFAKWIETNL